MQCAVPAWAPEGKRVAKALGLHILLPIRFSFEIRQVYIFKNVHISMNISTDYKTTEHRNDGYIGCLYLGGSARAYRV